MNDRDNKLSWS